MKKLTLLVMLVVTATSFAQLKKVETVKSEEIGKVGPFGMPKTIDCTKMGNKYTFEYKDMQFPDMNDYKKFSFEDVENTFEDLYKTIMDGFETMPKEDITLELPNYIISLKFTKAIGMTSVAFFSAPKTNTSLIGYSSPLTKKQVEKLFGKKK